MTQMGHLQTHQQSQHHGVRYPCALCGHKATAYLKLHVHTVHQRFRYS